MLCKGVYPAAVTPFDEKGRVDMPGVARLLAWFEACGCRGAVLAGTNGEGPSLSAPEKRDLLFGAMPLRGQLDLVLGIATPSLEEAVWLCKRAAEAEAAAVLLMPPFYFRDASEEGIYDWFMQVMERSPAPVLVYNFPQKTGIAISPELMGRLSQHECFAGLKDSSGSRENLEEYRGALDRKPPIANRHPVLFVGNEELLLEAMHAGWTGTISGAANILPMWLSQIVKEYGSMECSDDQVPGSPVTDAAQFLSRDKVEARFDLLLPCLAAVRSHKQPAMNKALLHKLGILPRPDLRAPLSAPSPDSVEELAALLTNVLGLRFDDPAANCPTQSDNLHSTSNAMA